MLYSVSGAVKLKLDSFFDAIYDFGEDGLPTFRNLRQGKWVTSESGERLPVKSPITGETIAWVQSSNQQEAASAVEETYASRHKIRQIPAIDRIKIFECAQDLMRHYASSFIETLVADVGKPRQVASGELHATRERLRMTVQEAQDIFGEYIPGDWAYDTVNKIALVIREPVGTILAIPPFNYPLYISAAKVVPALLSGNSVIAKPPSDDPLSLLLFAHVLLKAGIPEGSLTVITGRGGTIGDLMVGHKYIGMISFTGSTETGRRIAQTAGIKKLHLELGGKGVALVLPDADLDLAAEKCVAGALKTSGQRCDAISLVLVHKEIHAEFIPRLVNVIKQWRLGDPRDDNVKLGPLINKRAVEHVKALVDDAVAKGATLVMGGQCKDLYFEPTLVDNVPMDSRLACEETFGPVVAVMQVSNVDEAIEIANRPYYGLDSCVFGTNFYTLWKVAKKLETGGVTINDLPSHGIGAFPFGGVKGSGIGREGLGYSIEEMTVLKTIAINLAPAGLGKPRLSELGCQ